MFRKYFVVFFAAASFTAAVPRPKLAPSIITIGDSTVTSTAGWGAGFCEDTKGLATCTNLAVSGTTTRSWKSKPEYKTMLTSCQTPETWATIQFGHNDYAGCKPILATSLARRVFTSEYEPTDILGPYANETINVAAKLGLPLLPLLNDSLTYITKLGKTQAYLFNYGGENGTVGTDRTHLNSLGWKYFGRMVADEIHALVPELRQYITPDPDLSNAIASGTILAEDM